MAVVPGIVSVGPAGGAADFNTSDQNGFNLAVASLAATGGTIVVWPGTYSPTAEYILTGANIEVIFEPGAIISLAAGVHWAGKASVGGAANATAIFILGSATNCVVRNLYIVNNNTTTTTVTAVLVAGGVYNCEFHNAYAENMTRWARAHSGYYVPSGMAPPTFDGGVHGVVWCNPRSSGCGINWVPDGGGSKFFNGSTSSLIENVTEYAPEDLDCQFTSWDSNPQSATNPNPNRNLERFGGHAEFTTAGTNGCFAIFIEAAYAAASQSVRIFGGKYDGLTPNNNNIGLVVGNSNSEVSVEGAEFWNFTTGCKLLGIAGAAETGNNVTLEHLKILRCTTGIELNGTAGGPGSIVTGVRIRDCLVDDAGAQVTTTGLSLNGSASKQYVDLAIEDCDFSKIASGGTKVNYGSATGPVYPWARWRGNRGMTDQGMIATPLGTTTINEVRNNGTSAAPTAGVNYKLNLRSPVVTSAGGTGVSITVQHPDGSTLGTLSSSGTGAAPAASRWYQVQGAAATVASTGGTGVVIFAIGPDGTVLLNGPSTCAATSIPIGSYISWGGYSVAPTVTVTGIANPFATLSGVASLTSLSLLWGSSINFGSFSVAPTTLTITENGASVGKPFFPYREISLMGAGSNPVTATTYEVRCTSVLITSTGGTGVSIAITDQLNNTIASGLTTLTAVQLDPGYRVAFTFTVAPTVTVAVALT
jgi:hypothetical protein